MNQNLPAFGELPSASRSSARIVVERLLSDPTVFIKVEPFFNNGGVCGHKVMDVKGAVDVIRFADKGKELTPYNLTDFALGNVLKNALRTRYHLNSKWKIDGLSPKVAALIATKSAE